ncbi:isoleucyl-tRNA synthetase [Arthroderma uncinatum]|uniref:isoleucyl-tRNA synthetase n=1 Tax=Arthroderma uncinatum TaxID=74035 RepID=UPI00144AF735|nr:isoleucyl-tRNA synthetase [Arthroderma uncinatum]KAF3480600.1 isoleucyl-tRNA synthetase [Arthroderma uncinatum]
MATARDSPASVFPGRALGFLTLGASLHHVLTRLKSLPEMYTALELIYDSSQPLHQPVIIRLPENGLRLRFDGPDQRLRLIEVLDFSKNALVYKTQEIAKASKSPSDPPASGPGFRHIYNRLFGPTYPGEYIPPAAGETHGIYVLSYPGVAFSFTLLHSAWSEKRDFVSLMSSSAASFAVSMAIFQGSSWSDAQSQLYTRQPQYPRSSALMGKNKESVADEVELVKVHEGGHIELMRRSSNPFSIILGETTPQDLITELGPPDAIYRKSDSRILIHGEGEKNPHGASNGGGNLPTPPTDPSDPDPHFESALTDESEEDSAPTAHQESGPLSSDCFYNYFSHGFDILVAPSSSSDRRSPGSPTREPSATGGTSELTATKILLHGNVPGSYPFNRHRRCRWVLEVGSSQASITSETAYEEISPKLKERWRGSYSSPTEEASFQRGMVLNRGWGETPGSSIELLGSWEENSTARNKPSAGSGMTNSLGNTELYGFPGLLFEVLKNGSVNCLTVY